MLLYILKIYAHPGLFLFIFVSFSHSDNNTVSISTIKIEKIIDGVLGIRTRDRNMVSIDETTEKWWPSQRLLTLTGELI